MSTVHVVVPAGVADPRRPSGGNTYDQKVCIGLGARGWAVGRHEVVGSWPGRDGRSRAALGSALASIPDGSVVVVDGLLACALPEVMVPQARRLRLVVVVHLPLGCDTGAGADVDVLARESAVLHAVAGVVATSSWTSDWLLTAYALDPVAVRVVEPGVDGALLNSGSVAGGRLLCVGAVTQTKGQDVLVAALTEIADLEWSCRCVGSLDVDPMFPGRVRATADGSGVGERIAFDGPRVGGDLDARYAVSDLVVVPSRTETYGMVVTEALSRGMPVVVSDVGGLPETLGWSSSGQEPGMLVPRADSGALAQALRGWLTDAGLRRDLRAAARERRETLADWSVTSAALSRVLVEVAA